MVLYLNDFNSVIFKVNLIGDNNAYYINDNMHSRYILIYISDTMT